MEEIPELKPCPFCGGNKLDVVEFYHENGCPLTAISCLKCDFSRELKYSRKAVVDAWNTRTLTSQLAEVEASRCEVCHYEREKHIEDVLDLVSDPYIPCEYCFVKSQQAALTTANTRLTVESRDLRASYEAMRAENERLKALAEWRPITETDLPKVGDQVWNPRSRHTMDYYGGYVPNEARPNDWKIAGWTHFRPLNAPGPAPKQVEGDKECTN